MHNSLKDMFEMAAETKIDPLQLVPHRMRALGLIYEAYRGAEDQTTNEVSTRRALSDKFITRHSDELIRTRHISDAELQYVFGFLSRL